MDTESAARSPRSITSPSSITSPRLEFRKTQRCRFYANNRCFKGHACSFAHGMDELQAIPDLRKTKLCYAWSRNECPFDSTECRFAHGTRELRSVHWPARASPTGVHPRPHGGLAGTGKPRPPPPLAAAIAAGRLALSEDRGSDKAAAPPPSAPPPAAQATCGLATPRGGGSSGLAIHRGSGAAEALAAPPLASRPPPAASAVLPPLFRGAGDGEAVLAAVAAALSAAQPPTPPQPCADGQPSERRLAAAPPAGAWHGEEAARMQQPGVFLASSLLTLSTSCWLAMSHKVCTDLKSILEMAMPDHYKD